LAYSKIKKLFREKKYNANTLINKNGKIILEDDKKQKDGKNTWKSYMRIN